MSEEGDIGSEDSETDPAPAYQTVVDVSPDLRFERVSPRQFEEVLSYSACKHVYRCYDTESGRQVAWHSVSVTKLNNNEIEELCNEIQVYEGLEHPNIVFVIAAWYNQDKSEVVLITEVVSGGPLTAYLRKIKTPVRKVVRQWCREILEALQYLHSRGVLHRDLKIENIHIDSNTGKARLCNLGLSSLLKSNHTEYMAPEVYDEEYGTATDIYALGMSVLEMCTNSQPYAECSNPAAVSNLIISGVKPRSLSRIKDTEVRNFITSCLASADKRPSAIELLKHPFLSQQDNEMECLAIQLSSDIEPIRNLPIKLKILQGDKTHKVKFEMDLGEVSEDLAKQIVSQLNLDKMFTESITREIDAQIESSERHTRHSHALIVKPSSFTVLSPKPHNPSFVKAENSRVAQTASLIDMDIDDYIENHHISVSFAMKGSDSPIRIKFDYSLTFDRPENVARELVNELNLSNDYVPTISKQIQQAVANCNEKRNQGCQTPDLERNSYYKIEDHSTMAEVQLQDLSFDNLSPFATGMISPIEEKFCDSIKDRPCYPNVASFTPQLVKSLSENPMADRFEHDLRLGDKGECVVKLQKNLNKLSANKLKVSGTYDISTYLKVASFQEEQAMTIDGVIRKPTWDMILAESQAVESQQKKLACEIDWNKFEY